MKAILALAAFCLLSQAHGHVEGQVNMVDGKATKLCQDCENFFSDIKQIISSSNTTVQMEQLLKEMICSKLGTFESVCDGFIDMYVPQGLQYLASLENPAQVCAILGMCTEDMMNLIIRKAKMPKGAECDLCKSAVQELQALVRNPDTEAEVKNYIENNVCPLLGNFQQQCKEEVDTYATLVFQILVNELDPDVVCQTLGLCTQMKKISLSRIGLGSAPTKVKVMTPKKPQVMKPKVKDEGCVLCEFVIKELDSILEQNSTEAQIQAALDQVCSLLPSTISDQCIQFVNQYTPVLIELFLQDVSPDQVCQTIGLCQKTSPSAACVLCEFVMSQVDQLLQNNKSQASVEAALEKACGLLPDTINEQCVSFIEAYGPAVINLIVEELDPKEVCKTLRLCDSSDHVLVKKPAIKAVGATVECTICEFVMNELDTLIGENRTQQSIEAALNKVCSVLPETVRETCTDFVNTYGPAVIQLLIQELDPQAVCVNLGLCANATLKKQLKYVEKPVKGEECDFCVQVLTYVAAILRENATEEEIENALLKVCNFLPEGIRPQCTEFIKDYAVAILNLASSEIDPRQICEDLNLCQASKKAWELKNNRLYFKPSHLIGTKECTYGPSFWCANEKNAKKCNATEHCRKHVWN